MKAHVISSLWDVNPPDLASLQLHSQIGLLFFTPQTLPLLIKRLGLPVVNCVNPFSPTVNLMKMASPHPPTTWITHPQ